MPADDYALHNRKRGVAEVLPSAEEEEVVSNMPAAAADAATTVSSANHSPRMVRRWPGDTKITYRYYSFQQGFFVHISSRVSKLLLLLPGECHLPVTQLSLRMSEAPSLALRLDTNVFLATYSHNGCQIAAKLRAGQTALDTFALLKPIVTMVVRLLQS